MTAHKVYVRREKRSIGEGIAAPFIKRCVRAALDAEGVDKPCEVSVTITDDEGIRKINREFRDIDAPTDVLSFPMLELTEGDFSPDVSEIDPQSGLLPLGDIVVNAGRIFSQAQEYGHSSERELAYLVVHSTLHLLGYDHLDEGARKARMRDREEEIVSGIGYMR